MTRKPLIAALLSLILLNACSDPAPELPARTGQTASTESAVALLQADMEAGTLTAVQLTTAYIARIQALDSDLRAVVEINPDALLIAAERDAERARGEVRSALHGIPVLLKDNIDTADRMKTTAGSLALLHAPMPARDAFVVQQLRDAGAVILGKTNLSEWANFRSTQSSSGWSARGGQTRNPYSLLHTPCGSSSGSAVAVAADLSVLAVGTETDGSIICPAANNSIVGIKPTLGLISRSGIIPIAHSQDTAGPMARSVADAAALLSAMTGADARDVITQNTHNQQRIDYTEFLQPGALQGKRIGVMRTLFGRNPAVDALMTEQLAVLEAAGATLVDLAISGNRELSDAEFQVLLFEFKHDLNLYLEQRGGFYRSLEHLIRFNEVNPTVQMPFFGQEIFYQAQATTDLNDARYQQALQTAKRISQSTLDHALQGNHLDAIVAPSNGPGWLIDLDNGDSGSSVNYVSSAGLAAISGYPAVTVPAGYIDGRPVGVSFMGAAFSEAALISMAYDFEQKTQARRPPVLRVDAQTNTQAQTISTN